MPVLQAVSTVLFTLVTYVSATMAWKGLTAKGLLPFHQAAAGRDARVGPRHGLSGLLDA